MWTPRSAISATCLSLFFAADTIAANAVKSFAIGARQVFGRMSRVMRMRPCVCAARAITDGRFRAPRKGTHNKKAEYWQILRLKTTNQVILYIFFVLIFFSLWVEKKSVL